MPRHPHKPTPETHQLVQLHATVGTPQELVCKLLGLDGKTLRKWYREDLDLSRAKANATIGGALFNKAKGGDTVAMIFWLKTRAGWRERDRGEDLTNIMINMQKDTPLSRDELIAELERRGLPTKIFGDE